MPVTMSFADHQSIFQSELFAEFQKEVPYRGKAFLIEAGEGEVNISAMVIRIVLRHWSWLWLPYGPVFRNADAQESLLWAVAEKFYKKIDELAAKERAIFVRIEPGLHTPKDVQSQTRKIFSTSQSASIQKTSRRFTPDHTLVLDLSKSEAELLADMKPKGRYNIKIAEKNGIAVRSYGSSKEVPKKDFDEWYAIMRKTGERDGFGTHGKEYYKTLIESLGAHKAASLFLAYDKNGAVAAGSIVTFFDDVGMYYYGASSYTHRALMAPYAIQWKAILEAKKRGCAYYDFLGISPADKPKHSWRGVTDFKKKFGGQEISMSPAFDLVYRPLLYRGLRLIKKV